MYSKQSFTFDDFLQRNIVRNIIFSSRFLLANSQVLCVLIGCNRQLLLIKIYAGISNILKKVHHLLKLRPSNKGIKQMFFLLFSNLIDEHFKLHAIYGCKLLCAENYDNELLDWRINQLATYLPSAIGRYLTQLVLFFVFVSVFSFIHHEALLSFILRPSRYWVSTRFFCKSKTIVGIASIKITLLRGILEITQLCLSRSCLIFSEIELISERELIF